MVMETFLIGEKFRTSFKYLAAEPDTPLYGLVTIGNRFTG